MPTPQSLLERYIEAKDLVRLQLMQEIYAAEAVLTFSIATDSISFRQRVVGIDGITTTLVVAFGAKYSRCKTFYVCDSTPQNRRGRDPAVAGADERARSVSPAHR